MTWESLLQEEFAKPQFRRLLERVAQSRRDREIYPPAGQEFRALELCPAEAVRVVILGQDPYHKPGQAMGLSFSVPEGTALPPSLRNIYTELASDLNMAAPKSGDLSPWARQGVLLLNTVLTVERGKANSHSLWGWQDFSSAQSTGHWDGAPAISWVATVPGFRWSQGRAEGILWQPNL